MKNSRLIMCVLMTALMCISSTVSIPLMFTPVPVTFQAVACLIAGAALGASDAALVMIIYVLLGVFGLPVFAGMNSGAGYLLGPTGGFIIGFIPYAYLTGRLTRILYKRNTASLTQYAAIFVSMAMATIVFYLLGAAYFSVATGSGLIKSVALAVLPFIWIDLFKIVVAAIAAKQLFRVGVLPDY